MTVSNTATGDLDVEQIIDEAFERAGVPYRGAQDLRSGRRSIDLLMADWANRGLNLWTVEEGFEPLLAGIYDYALPNDTIDLIDVSLRTGADDITAQQDIPLRRISTGGYAAITNKLSQGRPTSILIERFRDRPIVRVWPVPDVSDTYVLAYWRIRRIFDAGGYTRTMDTPWRFVPALAAGVAHQIALKRSGDPARIQMLKAEYEEAFARAAEEDSSRTELLIYPEFG